MAPALTAAALSLFAPTQVLAQSGAPGGAYIGYYQENPLTNPEDPVPGAIYLQLPAAEEAFSGEMFFTYIGCQGSNIGNVTGRKSGATLTGNWSGTVDDSPQRGSFRGSYDAAQGYYSGTYTNAGGKQHRDLNPCIEYYIAPDGRWALFPIEQSFPADFDIRITPDEVRWPRQPRVAGCLLTVFDAARLEAARGNAIVWQTLLEPSTNRLSLDEVTLVRGRQYVLSVTVLGETAERLAFGSKRFVGQ